MYFGASHLLFERAKQLRKVMTYEEELGWGFLNGSKTGYKFRRQHPLLFYIADFYCHQLKLVIEIDGSIHSLEEHKIKDKRRQEEIEELDITVLRFTNTEVKITMKKVVNQINQKIKELENSRNKAPFRGLGGIIFSAGLGTRFKPWTDHHPKALAMVNGKSLLQRNIEYLQQYGIVDVVINVHHFPQQIKDAVNENKGWGSNVIISDESDEVLETGGGLMKARQMLDNGKPFVSLNADILTDLNLTEMFAYHEKHKPLVTFGVTDRTSSRVLLFDKNDRLCGWKNLQTGEEKMPIPKEGLTAKAYSCVVIYEPEIFSVIKESGKFSIMNSFLSLAADHLILGYDHSGDHLCDVGKPDSIAIAEKIFK